jgi:excisionase family DNA binding protein
MEQFLANAINLTVNEFCVAFNIGRTKFYQLIAAGEVEAIKLGKKTLIPRAELDRLQARLPRMRPSAAVPPQSEASLELPDVRRDVPVLSPQPVSRSWRPPPDTAGPDHTS